MKTKAKSKRSVMIYQLKEEFIPIGYAKGPFIFTPNVLNIQNMVDGLVAQGYTDPYANLDDGVSLSYYDHAHTWLSGKISHTEILSDTFKRFQRTDDNPLPNYAGRSLSVTDIVVIDGQAYLCRISGWLKIEALKPSGEVEDFAHA